MAAYRWRQRHQRQHGWQTLWAIGKVMPRQHHGAAMAYGNKKNGMAAYGM